MDPAIALQLFSVKEGLQKDLSGTLEQVAAIGYRNVEPFTHISADGLTFGKAVSAADMRKLLDRFGLRAVSCHFVPMPGMDLDKVLADLNTLGVDSLACAIAFFEDRTGVLDFCTRFSVIAEACKKHGVQLYYHNHYHEFQVFGDKSVYELMIEYMDAELVKFELDTYWAVRAGQDPIYWLKKLGSRCDLLHQKDLPAGLSPVNLFEKIGYDARLAMDTMWGGQDPGQFTEIGEGVLTIPGILAASRKYNHARYIIVEQDQTTRTELESIALSFANLTRLLAAA